MKKTSLSKKLRLDAQLVRTLADDSLARVAGANGTYLHPCTGIICSGYTGRCSGGSGCSDCIYCKQPK